MMVVSSYYHTLAVMRDGTLWTFESETYDALSHNDQNTRLVLTHIKAQHFGNVNIVSVASAFLLSAAVTKEGTLCTWVEASGLGHINREAKWVPTHITPSLLQRACVGPYHDLPPALLVTSSTHHSCYLASRILLHPYHHHKQQCYHHQNCCCSVGLPKHRH